MDQNRAAILGEIATEASIERASFLTDAAGQFMRFLEANGERIKELGGLVLIDDDPDYLSIAPDGTFYGETVQYRGDTTRDVGDYGGIFGELLLLALVPLRLFGVSVVVAMHSTWMRDDVRGLAASIV